MKTRDASTVTVVVLAAAFGLGGCFASGEADPPATSGVSSAPSPGDAAESAAPSDSPATSVPQVADPSATPRDPEDVPPDDTDYSVDAGNSQPTFTYEPEPEPADSIVVTLCNLNQEFFRGLRAEVDGSPVADDSLRTNLIGLGDLIDEWDTLRIHYPQVTAQIDRALEIYDAWESAIAQRDAGDAAASSRDMANAEEVIGRLPETGTAPVGCAS